MNHGLGNHDFYSEELLSGDTAPTQGNWTIQPPPLAPLKGLSLCWLPWTRADRPELKGASLLGGQCVWSEHPAPALQP